MRSELPVLLVFMLAVALIFTGLFFGCGCGESTRHSAEAAPPPKAAPVALGGRAGTSPDRFRVESHGGFSGGYGNHEREILILTDTQTGIQYLAVTGCGTTELRQVKQRKKTVTEEE